MMDSILVFATAMVVFTIFILFFPRERLVGLVAIYIGTIFIVLNFVAWGIFYLFGDHTPFQSRPFLLGGACGMVLYGIFVLLEGLLKTRKAVRRTGKHW